jgi:apolipoprotein N-acyltransferase
MVTKRTKKITTLFAISLLTAAFYFLAFLSDIFAYLSLISFTFLFGYWQKNSPLFCFLSGFIFTFFFASVSLFWIYGFFHDFSALPLPISLIAGFILILILSFLPYSIAGFIWSKYQLTENDRVNFLLLLPCSYLFGCLLQNAAINTIPWYFIGNALIHTPLAGWGPIVGVYGMSGLAVCTVGSFLLLWKHRKASLMTLRLVIPIWLIIWLGGWFLSHIDWTKSTKKAVNLLLIQGNFKGFRNTKGISRLLEIIKRDHAYTELAKKNIRPNTVVIFPENSIPSINAHKNFELTKNSRQLKENNISILLGTYTHNSSGQLFNALVAVDGNQPQVYHKFQLIAFGEYNPFEKMSAQKTSGIIAGRKNNTAFIIKGQGISPLICYESTLPSASFYKKDTATWLVAISNNAWFKRTWTGYHAYLFSQMRSLETGKPMAYVSNMGYTGVVTYKGRTQAILPPYQNKTLKATIQPRKGLTPYLYLGYWPLFIANLMILITWITLHYTLKNPRTRI